MHHAWLLTGPPGIGKATLAYRIARDRLGGRSLMDNSLDIPAADPVSQLIQSQGHGNLRVLKRPYDPKAKRLKKDIPVDEVRALSKFFQSTASETGEWRVCLIDTADDLNPNSENGILKLLEEPPDKTLFLLLSHEPGRLLPTIRSRCMHLPLQGVAHDQIQRWLKGQVDAPDMMQAAAVSLSRGAPGKALALAQNAETVLRPLQRFMTSLDGRGDDMALAKSMAAQKAQTSRSLFWDALIDTLQMQAAYVATGLPWAGPFEPISARKSAATWIRLAEMAQETRDRETAINLEKTAVLYDLASKMRAA